MQAPVGILEGGQLYLQVLIRAREVLELELFERARRERCHVDICASSFCCSFQFDFV